MYRYNTSKKKLTPKKSLDTKLQEENLTPFTRFDLWDNEYNADIFATAAKSKKKSFLKVSTNVSI